MLKDYWFFALEFYNFGVRFIMIKKVLLVGTLPPPIGGISVHLQRFINYSSEVGRNYAVLDLKKHRLFNANRSSSSFFEMWRYFIEAKIVHLHISNLAKIFFAVFFRLVGKKVVYTHHNSVINNPLFFRALCNLCHFIIFVNSSSVPKFIRDSSFQGRWAVLPAFIPPSLDETKIPNWLDEELNGYDNVISTNCHRLSYIDGEEVYGFDIILKAYSDLDKHGAIRNTIFVLLDPSNSYQQVVGLIDLPESAYGNRLLYLGGLDISFVALLRRSTFSIRATRTDGDSLSVRESLYLQVPVVASDIVVRPDGVRLFRSGSSEDLARVILDELDDGAVYSVQPFNCAESLFEIYDELGK